MVQHLRDFHRKVQAFCGLEADAARSAVAHQAANTRTAAQAEALDDVLQRLKGRGLTAAQERREGPDAAIAASECGQQTVQRAAEQAGQKDCCTKILQKRKEEKSGLMHRKKDI